VDGPALPTLTTVTPEYERALALPAFGRALRTRDLPDAMAWPPDRTFGGRADASGEMKEERYGNPRH
jgi:hypothetical protein